MEMLTFLLESKQMSEIEKKTKKGKTLTWGLAYLAPQAGPAEAQPTGLCQSPLTSRQEDAERVADARRRTPDHLLLAASL